MGDPSLWKDEGREMVTQSVKTWGWWWAEGEVGSFGVPAKGELFALSRN